MTIQLGKQQVSMMNPPNDGEVIIKGEPWTIGRNGIGAIVLRKAGIAHPDFYDGMFMSDFVQWINSSIE